MSEGGIISARRDALAKEGGQLLNARLYAAAAEASHRWDVTYGQKFFATAEAEVDDLITTGEYKLRRNGQLDMRYRSSRLIKRILPDWRTQGT